MPIGIFGQTDGARLGDTLQPRGDIDAVAHQIAVALLDDVAQMDTDAELNATLGRKAGVTLDHTVLHLDGAAHSVDHAAELNENSVAGALHYAPVMYGNGRVDQIAPERPQPRQCPILVSAGKSAVSDHIRRQDRREFPGLGHDVPSATTQTSTKTRSETGPSALKTEPRDRMAMSVGGPKLTCELSNECLMLRVKPTSKARAVNFRTQPP